MSEDIEALRAQLAAAEARAMAAEAAAARAQVEAARAALAHAEKSPASSTPSAPATTATESTTSTLVADSVPAPVDPAPAPPLPTALPLSDFAATLADAYTFDTPAVTLGTVLDGDHPAPPATVRMPLGMFNRHTLVAGATGTGKTRTLQLLAEGLSEAGTSVLLCDVKGDLTGLAEPGTSSDKLLARTGANGQPWSPGAFPVEMLTLGGVDAVHPGATVRVPISDFGPILLARALDLNTTQELSLQLIFSWADSHGLELVDLGDLRAVIGYLTSTEGKEELATIGGVSKATAGVILRALTALESQGGDVFFGEPGFDTADLMRQVDGKGVISLLHVGDMSQRPGLVSTVIMWLLADLFSGLPEVGDPERPKLVFFFDEAHLLFADATKEFLRQVVQTVRLIRSKGVGVVFVTQTPKDIPADVLAQLGSRVQHALRAATPDDQKKLKQTVATFPSTELDLEEVLTTLGTGEAVITVLAPDGRPTPVAPTKLWAPASVMGPATPETLAQLSASSTLVSKYAEAINPESAEEKLEARKAAEEAERQRQEEEERAAKEAAEAQKAADKEAERQLKAWEKEREKERAAEERELERLRRQAEKDEERRTRTINNALNSALRSATSQLGREITRSIFGTRKKR